MRLSRSRTVTSVASGRPINLPHPRRESAARVPPSLHVALRWRVEYDPPYSIAEELVYVAGEVVAEFRHRAGFELADALF